MFLSANNAAVATVAADSVSTINFGCEIYTCNNSNSNNCNLSDPQKQRHSLAASLLTSPSATTNNDRLLFSELSRNNLIYTSPIATSTRSTTLCSCVYYYNSTFGGTKMLKYPRTSSSNSSGFFEDDDLMEIYQTPPQSPISSPNLLLSSPSPPVASYGTSNVAHCLQRHIVRMFSANDASGTSAVAIDNKIEQAMDLVKSHLMIAVREEVEVLKEKISELMDKINQLEVENTLLKANISQETLQQLQMQTQLQIAGSGQTAGNNMITAPPQPPPSTAAAVAAAAGTPATVTAQNVAANNASNANNQVAPNNISNSNGSAATAEGSGSATPTAAAAPVAENQNIANSGQSNNANNTSEANNASNGTATGSVVTAGNTNGPMS